MEISSQPLFKLISHSYYGSLDTQKPKKGLSRSMLDEYIKQAVQKEKEIYIEEIKGLIEHFRLFTKRHIRANMSIVKRTRDEMEYLKKYIQELAKMNAFKIKPYEPPVFINKHEPHDEMDDEELRDSSLS